MGLRLNLFLISAAISLTISAIAETALTRNAPRKIAVLSMGYHDSDPLIQKQEMIDTTEEMANFLILRGYETTSIAREKENQIAFKFQKQINSILKELESGQIRKGDQVLLIIKAHGSVKPEIFSRAKIPGHGIGYGEDDYLWIESLQPPIQRLIQAGVQVALIDLSCYSGNAQDLSKIGACTISAQNRHTLSRFTHIPNPFTGKSLISFHIFYEQIRKAAEKLPGQNLEEIFLLARQNLTTPLYMINYRETHGVLDFLKTLNVSLDLPEISSAEQDLLRPLWSSAFFTNTDNEWSQSFQDLAPSQQPAVPSFLADSFETLLKNSFGEEVQRYLRFQKLRMNRNQWIQQIAERQVQEKNEDSSPLYQQLAESELDYERILANPFSDEREIYNTLYRALQGRGLPSNPCREFKF